MSAQEHAQASAAAAASFMSAWQRQSGELAYRGESALPWAFFHIYLGKRQLSRASSVYSRLFRVSDNPFTIPLRADLHQSR